MDDTVWSQIVALFDGFFRYTVLFLVFTVFTSIMYFFLQFPFKPPSKIHPEGPEALKPLPPALRAGFLRGVTKRKGIYDEGRLNSENNMRLS